MGRLHLLLMIPAFYDARDICGWDWHYAALLISPGIIWFLVVCLTFAGILSVISVQEIWRWWRRPRE